MLIAFQAFFVCFGVVLAVAMIGAVTGSVRAAWRRRGARKRRFDLLYRDALARGRGENMDGSPRRETVTTGAPL